MATGFNLGGAQQTGNIETLALLQALLVDDTGCQPDVAPGTTTGDTSEMLIAAPPGST